MRRLLPAILLTAAVIPGLWWRSAPPPPRDDQQIAATPLPLPRGCCAIGPIAVTGAWQLTSRSSHAHGFSALLVTAPGVLTAFSDAGRYAVFPQPDAGSPVPVQIGRLPLGEARSRDLRDAESATRDPATGQIWIGLEGFGRVVRVDGGFRAEADTFIPAMRDWPGNQGPEAMVRLRDGRFIVLAETYARWFDRSSSPGLVFAGDPLSRSVPQPIVLRAAANYRPTDMAQLPDGRVLIVMRQLRWPFPQRFAARLMVADPRHIRAGHEWRAVDIGELAAPIPMDNYEGLALVPEADGTVTGWLISDDNGGAVQRTLLLRLRIDPARLPRGD